MRQWFTFNGKSSKDFGVYISGLNTFGAPERDVDIISISGRNGDLISLLSEIVSNTSVSVICA